MISQQAVLEGRQSGHIIIARAHPTQQTPAQYLEYELFIYQNLSCIQSRNRYSRSGYVELEKRALARGLGPFRGSSTWMSRIRVRRVAHAVLWGDGLRFRVRDGRLLYYLPSTLCVRCTGRPGCMVLLFLLGSLAWRRRVRGSKSGYLVGE